MLNSAVNSSGAVSPAARATASMTPVRMPGIAVGSSTIHTVCVSVAPMPIAASFIRAGTMRMASSEVRMIVGSIRIGARRAPANAEIAAGRQHDRAVGEHAGEDGGKPGQHLRAEAHDALTAATPDPVRQIDRRQQPIGTLSDDRQGRRSISVPTMALPKPPPCSSAAGGSCGERLASSASGRRARAA